MICDKMRTTRILPLAATTSRVVVLTNLGAEANIRPRQRLPRWREPVPRRCGGFSSVTACGRIGFALSCSSTNPNSLRSHRTVFQGRGETRSVKTAQDIEVACIFACRSASRSAPVRINTSARVLYDLSIGRVESRRLPVRCWHDRVQPRRSRGPGKGDGVVQRCRPYGTNGSNPARSATKSKISSQFQQVRKNARDLPTNEPTTVL